jgi:predicted NAD/FAD-binding protein
VIGSGVSGLTAGYVLSRSDHVTLFEADDRFGGHADTHLVVPPSGPPVSVDTGFIVYNERTYPTLTKLFAELGVATRASEMSMSVRCAGCGLQYAGQRGLGGLAAGLRRGSGPYLRMLAEVPRFHRAARRLLAASATSATSVTSATSATGGIDGTGEDLTLGQFLDDGGYSGYFTAHFALPLVAAVWSCPPGTALSYPARYLFAFLANHGMLSLTGSPPWRTVAGGSRRYVERVLDRLPSALASTPVRAVHRYPDGADVHDASDQVHHFDAVVIATHPDQALRLLAKPTHAEEDVLGAFRYTQNPALLHTDARLLPARRRVRASWNYELTHCRPDQPGAADQPGADPRTPRISYDMNRLQSLPATENYIVTLGGEGVVDPARIIDRMDYAHPAYTPASVAAQRRLPELNTGVTAFAGAYHGWGFHEDGCRSGAEAARALGGTW